MIRVPTTLKFKEKCYRCYWKGYENCCVGYKPDFDCSQYFTPIDEYFYKWLTKNCEIPKCCLIKIGDYYEWVKEGAKT